MALGGATGLVTEAEHVDGRAVGTARVRAELANAICIRCFRRVLDLLLAVAIGLLLPASAVGDCQRPAEALVLTDVTVGAGRGEAHVLRGAHASEHSLAKVGLRSTNRRAGLRRGARGIKLVAERGAPLPGV